MAIRYAGIRVELREVLLVDKPAELLDCSPKGTVPVLQLENGDVIDESLDIMHWALAINDPQGWQPRQGRLCHETRRWIESNDSEFKHWLDRYKYADRYPEHPAVFYRQQAEVFIRQLDEGLSQQAYLLSDTPGLVDVALFPFLRQFALVDRHWFDNSGYEHLKVWLQKLLENDLFISVMDKYARWNPADKKVIF